MPAEGAEMRAGELPQITADILARLRARAPRVHCITNSVAQTLTANTLLAVGAIPSMTLAADEIGGVVALAGTIDRITDGAQFVSIENGHPLMAWVTAMGCAAAALNAALLAIESDAFVATAAGLLAFGVAGGIAGERACGPGSFPAALLDALYALDKHTLTEKARLT